jgi:hypothetical protein
MLDRLFDIQNLLAVSALLVAVQVMLLSTSPATAEMMGSGQVARLLETARSNGRRRTR